MSVFFFKQKTAYELRISDWSSDVCSSDLEELQLQRAALSQMAIVIDGHDVEIARRNTMRDARMPRCQLRFEVRPLEGVANFIDARLAAHRREERQPLRRRWPCGIGLPHGNGRAQGRERVCQGV